MSTAPENTWQVLEDALMSGKGYTREAAYHTVYEIRQDADGYELLSDAVNDLLTRSVIDPNRWDGDEDQTAILVEFLAWMPDLVEHRIANQLREQAKAMQRGMLRNAGQDLVRAADRLDPFFEDKDRDGFPVLKRRRDLVQVPGRVAEL